MRKCNLTYIGGFNNYYDSLGLNFKLKLYVASSLTQSRGLFGWREIAWTLICLWLSCCYVNYRFVFGYYFKAYCNRRIYNTLCVLIYADTEQSNF
jgi:hypothetical protein